MTALIPKILSLFFYLLLFPHTIKRANLTNASLTHIHNFLGSDQRVRSDINSSVRSREFRSDHRLRGCSSLGAPYE